MLKQTCACYLIISPQFLPLVSPINPHKATFLHMCYNKCSSYFEGKGQHKGIFSHDTLDELQWTPPPTPVSSCLMGFVAFTICTPWTMPSGTAIQESIHIYQYREHIFIASFKNSKINLLKHNLSNLPSN